MIDVRKSYFEACVYDFEVDYDLSEVKTYIQNLIFKKDVMLTTFLDTENIIEDPNLINFKNFLYEILHSFCDNIIKKKEPYISRSWFQAYDEKASHNLHIHEGQINNFGLLYYLQASEKSSPTIFYMPGHPYIQAEEIHVEAKTNKIVIFPGCIPHEVLKNDDNQRLIFSCNFEVRNENTI